MSRLAVCLVIGAVGFAVAGCQTPSAEAPLSPVFGLAVATMDRQIANPGPPSEEPPEGSAARGVAAVQRYEKGQVKPLQNIYTSNVASAMTQSSGADVKN